MLRVLYFSAFIISLIFDFVGIITNLFITAVSYKTWIKSHRLSSSDMILFSLGITRFLMLGLFLLNMGYYIAAKVERSVYISVFLLVCWMFFEYTSLWFVTLLNVLYCVKISSFQPTVFLLLKRNLSLKTLWFLGACVMISAFTTLLHVMLRQTLASSTLVTERNDTSFDPNEDIVFLVVSSVLSSFVQFTINVTCASLLIHSLRRHIKKMQRNATGLWNPHTEAHVGAMKLMVCFLVLYIPHSVASLFYFLPPSVKMSWVSKAICTVISTLYPPGHSVLIIFTHRKLKTKAKKLLCCNK